MRPLPSSSFPPSLLLEVQDLSRGMMPMSGIRKDMETGVHIIWEYDDFGRPVICELPLSASDFLLQSNVLTRC